MDRRVRATALIVCAIGAVTVSLIVGARPPAAAAAISPLQRMIADSAEADSAAFESLPPALSTLLDLRPVLTREGLNALPVAECAMLDDLRDGEERRRLHLVMPDSGMVVLYTTADEPSGALTRVEFVRRTPLRGQRGLVWNARQDNTSSMWWSEPQHGGQRRVERGNIPRGGPVPRVLRALGRRLLTLPCVDSVRIRR